MGIVDLTGDVKGRRGRDQSCYRQPQCRDQHLIASSVWEQQQQEKHGVFVCIGRNLWAEVQG